MRKSTKDKILYILKKDNEVSMKELMDYFSISEAAVRKQLGELVRLGFITDRTVKKDIGRPYHLYCLTRKGHHTFPNQYEDLPAELLKDLEASQGKGAVHSLLKARKEREKQELQEELHSTHFDEKIQRMVGYQEKRGYMIEVKEKENGDIEIKNFNCPIFNLASNYNIVCTNEKEMYRQVFPESKVISHNCMTKGGKYCCWTITNPEKEEQEIQG